MSLIRTLALRHIFILRHLFAGVGTKHDGSASVRAAHPIPPACGLYYFEVKIISKGKDGYMGIGLTAQQFRMNRLPGKGSAYFIHQ